MELQGCVVIKNKGFIFARNIKCFLNKTLCTNLAYKPKETKWILKLSKKFVIIILQVFGELFKHTFSVLL